jgi:PAS domain S-box-containing protein
MRAKDSTSNTAGDSPPQPGSGTWTKQAEETLRDSEAFLNAVIEKIPHMIFVKDAKELRFVKFNKAGQELMGYSLAEMIGKNDYDFFPKEMADFFTEADRRVLSGKEVVDIPEETIQTRDKGERVLHTKKIPIFGNAGQLLYLMGISEDITEHKRAGEELHRSQEEFKDLFNNAPVGFHEIDAEGRIVRVNSTELKMLGYSAGELLGQFVWKISAEEEVSRQASLAKLAGTLSPPSEGFERMLRRKDGSTFPVWIKDSILKREDGVITGTRAAIQDITEKKQAEMALNYERDLWRALLDTSLDHIYFKDTRSRFIKASKSQASQFGVKSTDEMVGKTDFDFFDEGHARPAFEDEQEIIRTGRPIISKEEREVWSDGHVTWASSTKLPMRDAAGKIIGIIGLSRDITRNKLAEEALRESEERFSSAFEHAPIGMALVSPEGRWLKVNKSVCDLVGYSEAELLTRTFQDITHPDDLAADLENLRRMLAGEIRTFQREKRYVHKQGHLLNALLHVSLVRNSQGRPSYFISQIQDITERRKLEEQLRQMQKMEAIGQLAGGMAHDFNNILAVIQMQADLLKSDGGLSTEQLDLADGIGNAAQRATALTRQLLMFSRKQTMQLRDLDLNESINEFAKMLRRTLGENVELQFKFAAQPLCIHADAGMIDQVLLNLAVNARDAMPKGGQLIIGTAAEDLDESMTAKSAQAHPGPFVCLSVSDTGCGIPPENLPRIFEPFFTTKGIGKGTGLGLATVFGIVQQHQGFINVCSEVGHGTTFRIYLPRLSAKSEPKPPQPPSTSKPGGNETILLVEDEAPLRLIVSLTLSRLGYRVLEAANGMKALEVWKQNHDDIRLLLTDMMMPGGMTGKDLGQRLLQENPQLKVIYMSGYSAEIAGKDFPFEVGVNFLTKPFAAQLLAQTVRQMLNEKSASEPEAPAQPGAIPPHTR